MPAASSATIDRLRRGPAEIEWFLAVAPCGDPIFRARIDDPAIQKGDREIQFDNVTGSYLDVEPGMTLWVGNAWNTYDVGTVRIKVVTPTSLTVAENDDILWEDDLWLTVPGEGGFREPWSVLPRMTEAGGVVTFYKDYDKVYTNEGDHLPPKANAGCPAIGEIDPTTGQVTINFVGDESYPTELGQNISGTYWTFPDGTPASSTQMGTVATPVPVVWDTAGFRYVRLDVVDSLGTTGTTFVPTWIFDERTSTRPYDQVTVLDVSESESGVRISVQVLGVNPVDFADRSLVVLGTRTWYGGESVEIGGFPYRENVYASGWIVGSTIHFDDQNEDVTFEFITTDSVARLLPGFTFYLEHQNNPTLWYHMDDPTADRIKHFHFEYHTTINQIAHVEEFGEGAVREVTRRGFPETDPYTQIQRHMYEGVMNSLIADRQGILRVRRDPQMLGTTSRNAVPIVLTIESDDQGSDWLGDVDVIVRHRPELGMVELGGFLAATPTPLLSRAPGDAPAQAVAKPRLNGYVLASQAEANLWSGLTWSKKAGRWARVHLFLRGFWPVFNPALQEYIRLGFRDPWGIGPPDNVRCVVREVNISVDQNRKTAITEIVVEPESMVISGVTIPVPPPPGPVPSGPPPIGPAPPGMGGELNKVILRTSQGIIVTTDFDESDPVWFPSNTSLSTGCFQSIRDMAFDFPDGERLFMVSDHAVDGGAYRCPDIFDQDAWSQRFNNTYAWQTIHNSGVGPCQPIPGACLGAAAGVWWSVGCDPATGYLMFIAGYEFPCGAIGWAGQGCRMHKRVFRSSDALNTCTLGDHLDHDPYPPGGHPAVGWAGSGGITIWDNMGLLTYACAWGVGSDRHRGVTSDLGTFVSTTPGQIWGWFYHLWQTRAGPYVIFYTDQGPEEDDLAHSSDHGATWVDTADLLPDAPADTGHALKLHFLNANNVMMISHIETVYSSINAGFNWTGVTGTPDGLWCLAPCADPTRYPDGTAYIMGCRHPPLDTQWIWLTTDLGQTFTNKTGNLGSFLDHGTDIIYQIIPVQETS